MAVYGAEGKTLSPKKAKEIITAEADYEEEKYANYRDTSAFDTTQRLIKGFFNYQKAFVRYEISALDIIAELEKSNIVIVPANGQIINNPHFTQPGPERHMIVIRGYDMTKEEFITNDPGIKEGELYRYPKDILINGIRDYPTGNHLPITEDKKAMIVVSRS